MPFSHTTMCPLSSPSKPTCIVPWIAGAYAKEMIDNSVMVKTTTLSLCSQCIDSSVCIVSIVFTMPKWALDLSYADVTKKQKLVRKN